MGASSFVGWVVFAIAIAGGGAASAGEIASPRAALHVGRIEGERVTWESSFVGNAGSSALPYDAVRIDLARPVFAEVDAIRSPGVDAVLDPRGAIVAFAIDPRRVPGWRGDVTVSLHASVTHDGADLVLAPPLARGGAVQRVEISGDGELRFEPAPALGLVHYVGSWATPGIAEWRRHEADALLGGRAGPLDKPPIYVDASCAALDAGLRGRAVTAAERARTGMILAIVAFVVLAAGCAAGYRWLGREAGIEEAEATLREEFERCAVAEGEGGNPGRERPSERP